MKKIFLLSLLLIPMFLKAQNVQLHYDMGKDRGYLTSTVEMFKPDNWGNTFLFVDMDYNVGDVKGVSLAYFEIARVLKLGKSPFGLHAEFNGGFGQFKAGEFGGAYTINNAWLGGLDYSWNNADFSRGFSLKVLYKNIRHKHDASFQLTGVWYANCLKNKISFTGFADFWREDNMFLDKKTEYVFLAEPQLWFNATKNFSLGTEFEFSNNFGGMEGFNVMPTVAAKWTF